MTTSNIRKFYLINANKEIYDLQDTNHFGHKPSGLGVSLSTNSTSENGYFEVLSQTSNQVTISFEMMFGGEDKINQYKLFNDFTKFLDYQPLQINYITDAFDYYATDNGKNYGMKCFYVTADQRIEEDIYEEN